MAVGLCAVEQCSVRGIAVLVTLWPQNAAGWQLSRVQVAAGPGVLLLWGWMWPALAPSKDWREHEKSPAAFLNP